LRSGFPPWSSRELASKAQAVDYLALIPRAIPGLAVGLVLLWVLVFIKPITPLREMLVSVWLAYAVVWLACGSLPLAPAIFYKPPRSEPANISCRASLRLA
jgi:iron(III) transport system permease protein